MSDDEWAFEDGIAEEESFMQMEECLLPVSEEPIVIEEPDVPASSMPPVTARHAEPEAEVVPILPVQSHVLPEQETDTVSSSPCVRRVRLRSKTKAPPDSPFNVMPPPVGVKSQALGEPSEKGDVGWWLALDEEARTQWVDSRLKEGGMQEYFAALRANHKRMPPRYYSKCNRHDKRQMAMMWTTAGSGQKLSTTVLTWIKENFKTSSVVGQPLPMVYQGKQFLLTCNGDWGLLERLDHVSLSPEVEQAARELSKLDECQKVWLAVKQEAARIAVEFSADDWATCLEMCPKTFKEGTVRLHAHVGLQWTKRQKWRLSSSDMTFLNGKYALQSEDAMARRRKTGWQSFYYVVAPKVSQLFMMSTKEKFVDFSVNPHWIWNLVQCRKMSIQSARDELVASGNRLTAHLPNIDKLMTELVAVELREKISCKEAHFAKTRHPWKRIKPVDLLVADLAVPRERRMFLVLDGPSRTGKTQFIKSLFGREATLEVNAADEDSPSLQCFDYKKHRCILLDEAPPSMILRNRKVFQCPNAMVTLGQSKTNCHSYSIYLNETLLAIASNEWQESVDALSRASRDWIHANQVYVKVTRPLWQAAAATT